MDLRNSANCFLILLSIFSFSFSGCKKEVQSESIAYSNNFETNETSGIKNLKIFNFNNNKVAGNYNNEELLIEINNLPKHQIAIVEFDLFIHDTWDGNSAAGDGIGGPDIWKFSVDGSNYINTTFSNGYCPPGQHCPTQSYPLDFLTNSNYPKSGVYKMLPGVCSAVADSEGTSWYKISKTIRHNNTSMVLSFKDELVQKNTNSPLCDESWSIDNLKVRVIEL